MGNILNHNRSIFETRLSNSEYWDHRLYLKQDGATYDDSLDTECLSAYIDTTFPECVVDNELISKDEYTWDDAVNNGIELDNIGLTGVDNGYLKFDKDSITDEEFMDLFTNSKLVIDKDDNRLHVTKVDGNNNLYYYGAEMVQEDNMNVAKLNGGFYQGFIQYNNGCNYKILPTSVDNGWCFEFTLKPEDFKSKAYITREKYSLSEYNTDGYDGSSEYEQYNTGYVSDGYSGESSLPTLNDMYPENNGIFFYLGTRAENKWWRYYVDLDDNTELETADGTTLNEQVSYLRTDNKFITYNRSNDGFRAGKTHHDEKIRLQLEKQLKTDNYFIIVHRGKGGYTARTIKQLKQESGADYDILSDLYRNAIAFQVKKDGSVGYKFMVKDCENENGYSILQEWSNPGLVENNKWATITVRVCPVVRQTEKPIGYSENLDYMRLMFYVDGKLVLYSKEIPTLLLRALNDEYSKQEGVPYNISLGGGTQGLCDTVYEHFKQLPEYVLFLEREFGGTFNGYFKSFKFYTCDKNYSVINQNIKHEKNLLLSTTHD